MGAKQGGDNAAGQGLNVMWDGWKEQWWLNAGWPAKKVGCAGMMVGGQRWNVNGFKTAAGREDDELERWPLWVFMEAETICCRNVWWMVVMWKLTGPGTVCTVEANVEVVALQQAKLEDALIELFLHMLGLVAVGAYIYHFNSEKCYGLLN